MLRASVKSWAYREGLLGSVSGKPRFVSIWEDAGGGRRGIAVLEDSGVSGADSSGGLGSRQRAPSLPFSLPSPLPIELSSLPFLSFLLAPLFLSPCLHLYLSFLRRPGGTCPKAAKIPHNARSRKGILGQAPSEGPITRSKARNQPQALEGESPLLQCGFSACKTKRCVMVSLGLFRFLLGFGIGGDYPLSATIMSEMTNRKTRGAFVAGAFSMQGLGILASSSVTMVVCKILKARQPSGAELAPEDADFAWRLILMLGAIPAALTFYWRMMTPESVRYTALVERNVRQAAMNVEKMLELSLNELVEDEPLPESALQYPLFSKKFFHRHGRDLFSCICSWFLIDVVFYSSSLFQPSSYKQKNRESVFEEAFEGARDQAIITAWSIIPAYWFTVIFIDRIGRVKIQTMGFILLTIVYLAMRLPFDCYWKKHMGIGFKALYGLTFFFSNFGPNTTTFIVPAELFPARFRSTCHGISGAAGKLGAAIGSIKILWILRKPSEDSCDRTCALTPYMDCYCFPTAFRRASLALAGVCAVGAVVSFLFTPETKGRSLEENEKDDEPSQPVCADDL